MQYDWREHERLPNITCHLRGAQLCALMNSRLLFGQLPAVGMQAEVP